LLRYGPDVASRFGLVADTAGDVSDEEMEIAPEALSA
jgi:hypothetical protein